MDGNDYKNWIHRLFWNDVVRGGIAAGLAFAIISPLAMPLITGLQVNYLAPLVGQPDIKIDVQGVQYGSAEPGEVNNYTLHIRNFNNRVAEEVRITLYFKGCAVDRGFHTVNGSAFADPGVTFTGVSEESSTCRETIYIPDLSKREEIGLEYSVQKRQTVFIPLMLSKEHRHKDLVYTIEYEWQLNGMTFTEEKCIAINATIDRTYPNGVKCNG